MLHRRLAALVVFTLALGFVACSSDEAATPGSGGQSSGGAGGTNSGGGSTSTGGTGASSSTGGTAGSSGTGGSSAGHDCKNPDPAWLFCEDFEGMAAGYDAWRNSWGWTDHIGADDPGRMTSSNDAHTGSWSVHYPAAAGSGYQGADLIFRTCSGQNKAGCALDSYDQLYFRTYVKLAADHQRVHHFLAVAGSQQFWDAYGNAGCRPNGTRAMGTTVDFEANTHNTFFYTYFPDMKCDPGSTCDNYADSQAICDGCAQKDMPCTNGPECCWGNLFKPATDTPLPVDQWVCLEMMMKANTVGQDDGVMAYFIDGQPVHQETAMHFRDTDQLGLNMVRLQHYLETSDAQGHSNQVWFDDVVVSTQPIGCM
jgi:hypothetical protein